MLDRVYRLSQGIAQEGIGVPMGLYSEPMSRQSLLPCAERVVRDAGKRWQDLAFH